MNRVLRSGWTLACGVLLIVILATVLGLQLPEALARAERASELSELRTRLSNSQREAEEARAGLAEKHKVLRGIRAGARQGEKRLARVEAERAELRHQVEALEAEVQKLGG